MLGTELQAAGRTGMKEKVSARESVNEVEERVYWMTLTQVGFGAERECVCQRGGGLGLVMSCNWECWICSECLMTEDIWTVIECKGLSCQ